MNHFKRMRDILQCYLGGKDLKRIKPDLLWDEYEYGPLRCNNEVEHAIACLKALALPVGNERLKAWDRHRIFSYIIRHIPKDDAILDAGCGRLGGYLLYYLKKYGYKNLYGCDLRSFNMNLGSIKIFNQDITAMSFPSNKFGFVSCISVIEHNVSIYKFFKEVYRVLKSRGTFILSTDYWCEIVNADGIFPYGKGAGQMKIFIPEEMKEIQRIAAEIGFTTLGKSSLICDEPVVKWMDKKYTFILCGWTK
jgi:SAM-dependent methyltransferase